MDVISIIKTKARKTHKCDWCNCNIDIGEIYERQTISDSGSLITWKNHVKCSEISHFLNLFNENPSDGLSSDDFQESIKDEFLNIMSEKFKDKYESKDFKHLIFLEKLDVVCRYYLEEKNQRI